MQVREVFLGGLGMGDSDISSEVKSGFVIRKVLDGDYCTGCGACAYVAPNIFSVDFDKQGKLVARIAQIASEEEIERASSVCPFAAGNMPERQDEDTLAQRLFGDNLQPHQALGGYLECYAGHVTDGDYRELGSSGGYISWLLSELLRQGEVDSVLHVHRREITDEDNRLFAYAVSHNQYEVKANAKSFYYPVTLIDVLDTVRNQPGRYVITGVPCFIKAVRLLQMQDEILARRIKYCVGLVCGHLKSRHFADTLGWQLGIAPGHLTYMDFRHKIPGRSANRYGIQAEGTDIFGKRIKKVAPMEGLIGADWGVGFFKYNACSYCDDVLAETADVAVGDAWLPQYVNDSKGANVIVLRDKELLRLTQDAIQRGELEMTSVAGDIVMRSQAGGLRDRRSGLAYRLYKGRKEGKWTPNKRVCGNSYYSDKWFRNQQDMREKLVKMSHLEYIEAVSKGSIDSFQTGLEQDLRKYHAHQKNPLELIRRAFKKALLALSLKLKISVERSYER
jgi:coenzyme F420-reducing hydrogenase beta subunit